MIIKPSCNSHALTTEFSCSAGASSEEKNEREEKSKTENGQRRTEGSSCDCI